MRIARASGAGSDTGCSRKLRYFVLVGVEDLEAMAVAGGEEVPGPLLRSDGRSGGQQQNPDIAKMRFMVLGPHSNGYLG